VIEPTDAQVELAARAAHENRFSTPWRHMTIKEKAYDLEQSRVGLVAALNAPLDEELLEEIVSKIVDYQMTARTPATAAELFAELFRAYR